MFSPLQLGNCRWSRPCIVVGITTFPGAQDTNFELLLGFRAIQVAYLRVLCISPPIKQTLHGARKSGGASRACPIYVATVHGTCPWSVNGSLSANL